MVLYICYHNPFGTRGGGSMASHAYLRAFCEIYNGQLDLICSSAVKDEVSKDIKCRDILFVNERSIKDKMLSIFTGYMNRYVSFTKNWLKRNHHQYDMVVFDHSNIAGTLVKMANNLGLKTVTIHHNYEKEYFRDNNHGLYRMLFLHHVIRLERIAYKESLLNLFLTKQDLHMFNDVYGISNGHSEVLGAFEYENYSIPEGCPKKDDDLTFIITGSLGNYQTEDAVSYFFKDLYGYLPADCRVIIAGRNPSRKVIECCQKHSNVKLIPNPDNMNDVISMATIYICPTRIGGGLKLRVMDGLKNGLPVITHVCSARGFDAFEKEQIFKSFSTPQEFKTGLSELIDLSKTGLYSKERVQNIYKKHFSFESGKDRLRQIVKGV